MLKCARKDSHEGCTRAPTCSALCHAYYGIYAHVCIRYLRLSSCIDVQRTCRAMTDVQSVPDSHPATDSQRVDLQFETATETSNLIRPVAMSSQAAGSNGLAVLGKRIRENANVLLETRKPLSEFLDRSAMSKPNSIGEVRVCSFFDKLFMCLMPFTFQCLLVHAQRCPYISKHIG
jgi:hypothetical protein